MKIFRKKWIIYSLIVIGLGIIGYLSLNQGSQTEYVLADAVRGEIVQTVSVTGSIKADPTLDLHFQKSGEVKEILVEEGERVSKGEVLASLENKALELEIKRNNANVAYATAEYNKLKAGSTSEAIQIAEADVKSAEASYNAALTDLENTKSISAANIDLAEIAYKQAQDTAESAQKELETTTDLAEKEIAKLKLDDESTNTNTVALDSAYAKAQTTMAATLSILQDSMYIAEKIVDAKGLGSDDIPDSERYKFFTSLYGAAESDLQEANNLFSSLTGDSPRSDIDEALAATIKAANSMSAELVFLGSKLQSISYYGSAIGDWIVKVSSQTTTLVTSLTSLNEINSTIQNLKTGSAQDTETLILSYQLKIDQAQAAYTAALNALDKAKFDLEQSKTNAKNSNNNAEAAVDIKKAALNAAKAALELKRSPVRQVDLAPLLSQISLANVALEIAQNQYKDSQLIAPIDGQITFIHGKVGENISLSETALKSFLSMQADNLIVEANVPETDVSKINPGDKVEMTVDAFDFTEKFHGTVVYVDPAETVVQGVVYYQIKTAFDLKDDRLKSGMTTNLDIITASKQDVLIIPARAIKYEDSTRYVEVLENGKPKKVIIQTGLESDQYVEVTDGLNEGDKIITFAK